MKHISKILLAFTLVVALGFSSSITSFAASSTKGGTWRVTDFKTSESLSFTDIPVKITYIPYSMVKAFHNADLPTDGLKEYLEEYGSQALTTVVAKEILKKFGVDLTPLVGGAFVLYDIYAAIIEDSFNTGINAAYKASKGMVYTVYQAMGGGPLFFRCTNWADGKTMPENVNFKTISGYAVGKVTVEEYDFDISW